VEGPSSLLSLVILGLMINTAKLKMN